MGQRLIIKETVPKSDILEHFQLDIVSYEMMNIKNSSSFKKLLLERE
jgi:hypothetical protein